MGADQPAQPTMRHFRVAAVQATPVFLDREATITKGCALIAEAAGLGARLIAFPEVWVAGYPVWLDFAPGAALWDHPPARRAFARLVASAVRVPGPAVEQLGAAARRAHAYVVIGVHELAGSTIYDSLLYFGRTARSWASTASCCRPTRSGCSGGGGTARG